MDVSALCAYLNVKESWIYERTHLNEIPFMKLGGQLRFRRSTIDKWLSTQETPAVTPYADRLRAIK
jgi:excisionase family DNA binding protein